MRAGAVILLVALCGCAIPTSDSMRPRGVDLYGSGGRSQDYTPGYPRSESDDWRVGINVHFDVTYADEYE